MELKIINPSEDGFLKEITFNHEEIKQELALRLEKYKGLVYSDKEIKLAKEDRAKLNKFKEAIENKRKEVKKQCLLPYEAFEIKIKEITDLINQPINEIDSQVKAYEENLKEEKRQQITGIYNESIGDLNNILPLTRLWNEKWLNATYKIADISEEIITAIEKVKTDLTVIEGLNSEFDLQIKDKFLQTLDLSAALQEKTRLEEQKAKLEAYKAQQEEKAQQAIVIESNENHELTKESYEALERVFNQPKEELQQEEILTLDIRFYGTRNQLDELKKFLVMNHIKFGRVN